MPFTAAEVHYGPLKVENLDPYGLPLIIRDKVFAPNGPGQTAIDLSWVYTPASFMTSVIFDNVWIVSGFKHGVKLHNAFNAQFKGVNIFGGGGIPNPDLENAITLSGQSNDVGLNGIHIAGAVTGLLISGGELGHEPEGVRISNFSMVGVQHGIVSLTQGQEPGLFMSQGHINATSTGIFLNNRREWFASDLLLYGGNYIEKTKDWPFYGILGLNSPEGEIRGVKVSKIDPAKQIVTQHFNTGPVVGEVGFIQEV